MVAIHAGRQDFFVGPLALPLGHALLARDLLSERFQAKVWVVYCGVELNRAGQVRGFDGDSLAPAVNRDNPGRGFENLEHIVRSLEPPLPIGVAHQSPYVPFVGNNLIGVVAIDTWDCDPSLGWVPL